MDKYDKAIEHLLSIEDDEEFDEEVKEAWENPYYREAGCLFTFIEPTEGIAILPDTGCLTQIRQSAADELLEKKALDRDSNVDEHLTKEIVEDERIPLSVGGITRENLHVFAEWQRKIDKRLDRE